MATDGSDGSGVAVENAVYVAGLADARVHALFVVDSHELGGDWDVAVEREEARGERAVEAVESTADAAGIPVEKHLRRGRAYEEILAGADACDADLIVMGTHGRSGIGRFVNAGSTAERVVRHATVPVLTARLAAELRERR